jgi:tRNA-2-methylthio-N6-dimethylallyladenosine synthase
MAEKFFSVKVIGCQMNVYDANRLRAEMISRGWTETDDADGADFVFFLTCGVRERAERKAMSELGRFRSSWERRRGPKIALLGCMASRIGEKTAAKFPWISVVAGPSDMRSVPDAVESSFENGASVAALGETPPAAGVPCVPVSRNNPHKAYITIANGCDQFCSYCVVPYLRGRFESRPPEDVMREAEALAGRGVVEITLLGQNVDTYGRDFAGAGKYRFSGLLGEVAKIRGLRRVRFTTSHPSDFSDDILDTMSSAPSICPGINLPVQAGSDKVLREMNRGYTRDEYIGLVGRIRSSLPEVGLTTDLIVGFPGETEDEFEQSAALLKELRFDQAHTAAYSPRDGTPAAARTDQIPREDRARRLSAVYDLQAAISREINESLIGRRFEVLLDEPAPKGRGLMQGRTITDKVVLVEAPVESAGSFRDVLITGASAWCLEGETI